MRRVIAIFKNSLHTINAIVAILIVAVYLITHFNLTGYVAKNLLTDDLASYLGTEVSLENAEVDIFNQIVLDNLLIRDQSQDTLLFARRAMVSFDLLPLLQKELEIHTVQLIDFDIRLSRQDSLSESNFQFLVDLFMPKDKDNRRKVLDDISLNSIILRSGNLRYDDFSKERRSEFIDPNHFDLSEISSNLTIQSSKENGLFVRLKRLSLEEKSGLSISKLTTIIELDKDGKRLDFNDINLSGQQTLSDSRNADISLVAFASMENKIFNAEILSLDLKVPEMLDIDANVKISDALSYADEMSFDLRLKKFNVSTPELFSLANRYKKESEKYLSEYLNNTSEISLEGEARGTIEKFVYLANMECFGETNADATLKGLFSKEEKLNCDIEAKVRNLEFNHHSYQEISLVGFLAKDCFDGNLSILDPLCMASAKGQYSFGKGRQSFDIKAEIENIEPYLLNITQLENAKGLAFSGNVAADIKLGGNKYPQGELLVDSLKLSRGKEEYIIPLISFNAFFDAGKYTANVNSDVAAISFESRGNAEKVHGLLKESPGLYEIFRLPFSIQKESAFDISLDSLRRVEKSEIMLPELLYDGATVDVFIASHQQSDSLRHELKFDYKKNDNHLASTLHATSLFEPFFVNIEPCKVLLNKEVMECGGATIAKLDANSYDLQRFSLLHKDQAVRAQGRISKEGKSDFAIHIENLGIDTLTSFLSSDYLKFGGIGTGDIFFTSDTSRTVRTKNLFVKDFSYLGGHLGDTWLNAGFDIDRKRLDVIADVHSKEDSISHISGYIQIAKKDSLDLSIEANKLNVDFLKHWVGGFLEDIEGDLSGDVRLYGLARELKLVGRPYVDVSFTNHLSGSRFFVKDYVALTKEPDSEFGYITLDNARILDPFDHEAFATASIRHRFLRKYSYDVRVDLPDNNAGFLLFDKPTHYNNELYWGQLFTSGTCLLRGENGRHRIEVSCRTVGKSFFNLSPNEENYSDNGYNFLTFRDKREYEKSENSDYSLTAFSKDIKEEESSTYIEFDLQAEATENCQVYVQMDPLAEDRLICRGTGPISLHYDPRHDITIGGEYNITQGNYLVTMRGDLINKEFKIQNGSRVTFPGSFSNAELDINAVYSLPSVNLRDLDESFATMASMNRTTLPVDCKLAVTGQLSAPQISFDLEVKNTSDDVQALVHNLIGTQEMLNREVFYLLLFSKFYTPEYASTSQNSSGSELSSFTSASLTSQLNNLLGHISDNFTLGTNFRSDKGDFSDIEMDVSLSTRLFSDRLILNGNFGYRDPANRVGMNNNTNSFIGDFDVEYLINPTGTLRAKAYSHYNERDYSINNALTTQGIGFVIRKDYKSLKELLFWKKMQEKK